MLFGSLKSPAIVVATALLTGVAAAACTGGTAGSLDGISEWEPATSSNERANAPGTTSGVVSIATPSQNGNSGSTTSDCSGTYNCSSISGGQNGTVVLSSAGGGSCSMKGTSFTVTSDNQIKQNNQSVGSWSAVGSSVVATLNGSSYTCSKTSTSTSGTTTLPITSTPDAGR